MFLHYLVKLEMLIVHMLPLSCYRKKPRIYPTSSVDSKFARFEYTVDNSMWEMLQEKVYKTRITALELSTTLLTNGFCSDDIAQL